MANRITSLCIDCSDAELLSGFWAEVLGWQVTDREDYGIRIQESPDSRVGIDFLVVPDGPKTSKNRLHLDVNATDRDQDQELERLLALGARPVDIGQGDDETWHVLADPEGNEFCLLRSRVEP
jgi:predicted enzyme related to lactoylglutathione lyase